MYFDTFEIELIHAQSIYERLDFLEGGGLELGSDLRLEPPFLAAGEAALRSSSSLSAACSQRFQKASTSLRNCCPRSI